MTLLEKPRGLHLEDGRIVVVRRAGAAHSVFCVLGSTWVRVLSSLLLRKQLLCISDCPDFCPSQRPLSVRAVSEIDNTHTPITPSYVIIFTSLIVLKLFSPRDLTPSPILSKTCLLSEIVFPTFVSLFHMLKPNTLVVNTECDVQMMCYRVVHLKPMSLY